MPTQKPLRRCVPCMFAVSLVLGAATTVAVAWALAAALPYRGMTYSSALLVSKREGGDSSLMSFEHIARPGMARQTWRRNGDEATTLAIDISETSEGHLAYHDRLSMSDAEIEPSWGRSRLVREGSLDAAWGLEDARGWPMLALWCAFEPTVANAGANVGGLVPRAVGGIGLFDGGDAWLNRTELRALPVRPLWGGFLADTALFGGAWMVLLALPRVVRGALWHRSGRCASCGYDLQGTLDSPCPECGSGAAAPAHTA